MIGILMNVIALALTYASAVWAYIKVPFINAHPGWSSVTALVLFILFIFIFPRLFGFFFKLVAFFTIINLIGMGLSRMGYNLPYINLFSLSNLEQQVDKVGKTTSKSIEKAISSDNGSTTETRQTTHRTRPSARKKASARKTSFTKKISNWWNSL